MTCIIFSVTQVWGRAATVLGRDNLAHARQVKRQGFRGQALLRLHQHQTSVQSRHHDGLFCSHGHWSCVSLFCHTVCQFQSKKRWGGGGRGDHLKSFSAVLNLVQCAFVTLDGTCQATARWQDSDTFQKAIEMALRCILKVNSHLPGFKL